MLNYFALGVLIFTVLVLFYGIIALHDIPYEIAKHRNHPHQDAIHAAGWVSLFTLHVIWPFLWIWATIYREDRGWGFGHHSQQALPTRVAELEQQLETLQGEFALLTGVKNPVADDSRGEG
ncbi:Inner membrane protein YiaW [Sinobacterium norvegicum]|uniref:Inner membrane protein YiaW n=2 Tax=Sinobacterium norvegicum TaxID=1641715 RepID=A0ABN8EHB4_9GAMM|nr:Inner membrane protein YiaW [Sinobacterium norvegicum]